MDDDEEHRRYGDSTILEPIVEQHDDEMATSPVSSLNTDPDSLEEERRVREEIQQFEELEKEFSSNRRGVRVKFDDERLPSVEQTTVIKTEPCFQINSTEDQVTKHFYQNEFQAKDEENKQFSRQISSKTPSELDSLEEEYIITFKQGKDTSLKPNVNNKEIYHKITDQAQSFPPGKSILKKSQKKEKISSSKVDRSSASRSPSPSSSSSKKQPTSIRSNSNEFKHLAEATAKQTLSQSFCPLQSLFEPTINIFDSSSPIQTRRPSRLRYYIKPYRGEVYIHPDINKQRSRSLSEQRLAQQTASPIWHTFSNQYNRTSNKKQHVSWSPVRDYIHQGRPKMTKSSTNIKESANKTPSSFSTRSTSSPCLRNPSSMIPISTRYRSSQHFSPSSIDSYETSSTTNRSLTPISQEKKEIIFPSPLPDIVHPQKKEHNETLQRYDRLLEKMRATDEQLQVLSRSWTNNTQPGTSIRSNFGLKKANNNHELLSPMILRICLIVLVIFNFFVVYFFNQINLFWSQYVAHSVITEQHDEGTSNF